MSAPWTLRPWTLSLKTKKKLKITGTLGDVRTNKWVQYGVYVHTYVPKVPKRYGLTRIMATLAFNNHSLNHSLTDIDHTHRTLSTNTFFSGVPCSRLRASQYPPYKYHFFLGGADIRCVYVSLRAWLPACLTACVIEWERVCVHGVVSTYTLYMMLATSIWCV